MADAPTETAEGLDPRVDIQSALEAASNYNDWIVSQIRAHVGRRVLDAGCGSGNLTQHMLDRELVVALDVWPDFVEIMSERFAGHDNLEVLSYDLADPALTPAVKALGVDSVFCCNVLEHVEDDRAALTNIATALPPGSPFFLLVPAFMMLFGEHDRADHHFRRYTKRSLARTLEGVPLRAERMYYMNMPGFFAWFLLGRVLRRPLDSGSIGLYDKVIPGIRAVEGRVKPPFGQTLVALLRTTG